MINTFFETIKCVSEIYFIIGIVSLLYLYRIKKKLFFPFFLILTILMIERALITQASSRYFAFVIIVFLLLFIFLLKKGTIESRAIYRILIFLLLTAIIFNFFKCYHSSRNNHVLYMKESIERKLTKNGHTTIFVDQKEFKRLCIPTRKESNQKKLTRLPSTAKEFDAVFTQYPFWENDAYFYSSDKALRKRKNPFLYKDHEYIFRKTENYITSNKKVYSVYSLDRFDPPIHSSSELRQNPFLNDVLEKGIIKSINPEYDAYIFQFKNQLIWFLGIPIKEQTEIIFQLRTNRPDLLPPKRIEYEFDNRALRKGDDSEIGLFGLYRVFAKDIPTGYPITEINVGLNTAGNVIWFKSFQVSDF